MQASTRDDTPPDRRATAVTARRRPGRAVVRHRATGAGGPVAGPRSSSAGGHEVYFVNPNAPEILGRPVYTTLADLPLVPDLVDVFRRREDLPGILDRVRVLGETARTFWLQSGLFDEAIARRTEVAGLEVVMDRCLTVEHARLHDGLHSAGLDTGVISLRRRTGRVLPPDGAGNRR